jgi:hypothetical protein
MILRLLSRNGWKMLSCTVFSSAMLYATLQSNAQTVTINSQGTHNGYFYSFWNDNSQGSASMTLGAAGNYSTTSSNVGNFIAGKGWATGKADRVVCFSGSFNAGSNGSLALYGWTKDNLIEYYVCENHGIWTPPGTVTAAKGTYVSDGGTYTIYELTRTNQLTMIGIANYKQYWSVRTQKRTSGTITFANHVAAWKNAGMNLGTTWAYQIMATEEYMSTGNSNITVSECNSCPTPAPSVTASVTYELGDVAKQLTATGTNLKWYTTETGGTPSAVAPTPSASTVGTTNYYVTATDSCESTRSSITVHVVQQVVTGVDDNFTSDRISVYPNPVTNDLYITGITGDYEYVISDYLGRFVLKGQRTEKIDVADLEAGVYIVKIKQDEGSKTIKISKF